MSPTLLIVVGMIYLGVAADFFLAGRPGMALAFIAYAIANVGFAIEGGE